MGGMALSTLVPATVQAMFGLARDPTDLRHIWVLHGLWLTAEAAGLSYVPYVQVGCLTLLWSVHLYYLKVSGSLLHNMVNDHVLTVVVNFWIGLHNWENI